MCVCMCVCVCVCVCVYIYIYIYSVAQQPIAVQGLLIIGALLRHPTRSVTPLDE